MSTLRVDNIQAGSSEYSVPTSQLRQRVLKTYRLQYRSGSWEPSDAYQWLPNGFVDYIPISASSRIRFTLNISYAHATGHAIAHMIFFANGVEQGRHSISGNHIEDMSVYIWDFASWGTSSGRIGYQMRSYADDNHEVRPYTTAHWDGGGGNTFCKGQIVIEEYVPGI